MLQNDRQGDRDPAQLIGALPQVRTIDLRAGASITDVARTILSVFSGTDRLVRPTVICWTIDLRTGASITRRSTDNPVRVFWNGQDCPSYSHLTVIDPPVVSEKAPRVATAILAADADMDRVFWLLTRIAAPLFGVLFVAWLVLRYIPNDGGGCRREALVAERFSAGRPDHGGRRSRRWWTWECWPRRTRSSRWRSEWSRWRSSGRGAEWKVIARAAETSPVQLQRWESEAGVMQTWS